MLYTREEEDSIPIVEWVAESPNESLSPRTLSDIEALWVETLAMSIPIEGENIEKEATIEANPALKGPISEWVSGKVTDFGLYLGTSYEGYEERVLKLLCDIEASSSIRSNEFNS